MTFALVTGASAGIGLELSRLFAKNGHDLVLVARSRDRLEALATELKEKHGRTAYVVVADLAKPGVANEIFAAVQSLEIHVDFLVNNAGFGSHGPFLEQDAQREVDMVQVNVASLVHLTRLFLPAMVQRRAGRVLNIASTAAFQAGPLMATYYATKAFVLSFTEAIAHEVEETGVTVTCHCPGPTETEFGGLAGNDKSFIFQKGQVVSAGVVARHAYDAMMNGERLTVHGFFNWLAAFSVRFAPRSVAASIAARMNAPPVA